MFAILPFVTAIPTFNLYKFVVRPSICPPLKLNKPLHVNVKGAIAVEVQSPPEFIFTALNVGLMLNVCQLIVPLIFEEPPTESEFPPKVLVVPEVIFKELATVQTIAPTPLVLVNPDKVRLPDTTHFVFDKVVIVAP